MKSLLISLTLGLLLSCTPKKTKDSSGVIENGSLTIPFPHPKTFEKISEHGFLAIANIDGCKSCHGQDLKGKEGSDSCYSCHPSYPHTQWKDLLNDHGKNLSETERNQSCVKCHNKEASKIAPIELKDQRPKSCVDCHSYPHPSTWMEKDHLESHGLVFKERDDHKCTKCHTSDHEDSDTNKALSCSNANCHSEYPHNSNFKSQHTNMNLGIGSVTLVGCEKCHITKALTKNDPTPAYTEKTCFHCHTYPHNSDWTKQSSDQFHGKFVKNSDTKELCDSCHGADWLGKGDSAKSCFNCHNNYPHSITFKTTKSHGQDYVYAQNNTQSSKQCTKCHGDALQGTATAFSCKTCHEYFPHSWKEGFEHGEQYRKDKDKSGFNCTTCHGNNLQGSNFAPGCKNCHSEYPHEPGDWYTLPYIHGNRVNEIGGYPPETDKYCKICHRDALRGWEPREFCKNCHTKNSSASMNQIWGVD